MSGFVRFEFMRMLTVVSIASQNLLWSSNMPFLKMEYAYRCYFFVVIFHTQSKWSIDLLLGTLKVGWSRHLRIILFYSLKKNKKKKVCCFNIDVFWQLLISGSLEVLDVDDLRTNVHYAGGFHPVSSRLSIHQAHWIFCIHVNLSVEESNIWLHCSPLILNGPAPVPFFFIFFIKTQLVSYCRKQYKVFLFIIRWAFFCLQDHECILTFWEVLKSFSLEHKKKFLK